MYYPFVRKALFQLDPERAHEFTFQQLRRITGTPFEALVRQKVPAKPVNCMGLTFKNPLGLAHLVSERMQRLLIFSVKSRRSLQALQRTLRRVIRKVFWNCTRRSARASRLQ